MNLTQNTNHTIRTIILLTAASLAAVTLASCIFDKEPTSPTVADRVLLIYFGGDNNLSGETYQKIEAIKKGLTTGNTRTLIYHDPANAAPVLSEIKNRNGRAVTDTIAVYREEDSASETVFARIIQETTQKYPAKNRSLLIFSHASGWLPSGALNNPAGFRSIIMDQDSEMEITAFARAIPDHTFDCIVFEACFMAGIEIAYELKDKTDYILASSAEIVSPGFTKIYPDALGRLLEGNVTAFAEEAFAYFDRQSGEMRSATFSIIRTEDLQPLAAFVAANCRLDRPVDILAVQRFDRNSSFRLFFDFEDYYSRLLDSDAQRTELQQLVNRCVIWKEATHSFLIHSNGFPVNRHSGLTTYIPQENFPSLNSRYERTAFGLFIRSLISNL
jgi:hypothetical protein